MEKQTHLFVRQTPRTEMVFAIPVKRNNIKPYPVAQLEEKLV
jgi:hypothetical protein